MFNNRKFINELIKENKKLKIDIESKEKRTLIYFQGVLTWLLYMVLWKLPQLSTDQLIDSRLIWRGLKKWIQM